jgi:hypothetical protein
VSPFPDSSESSSAPEFSKRAARRLIQRAYVLAGRNKHLRQHIREARLTTLWRIEDMELAWTVMLDRGKFEFERRPAKTPDATLAWKTAEAFFNTARGLPTAEEAFTWDTKQELRRFLEPVVRGFFDSLLDVLRHPFDDAGERLL